MSQYTQKFSLLLGITIFSHFSLGAAVDSITGDTGSAQTGVLVLSGGTSGAQFDSSAGTITQSFNNIALPSSTDTVGQIFIGGESVFHRFPLGSQNLFVGAFSGNFGITGSNNAGCGDATLLSLTSGTGNTACGYAALANLTEGLSNTAIGLSAGSNLVTGIGNILIGQNAAGAYNGSESNNIIIGSNPGVAEENDTIRIGDGGGHSHCYINGIYTSPINFETGLEVFVDDQGKLGTVTNIVDRVANIEIIDMDGECEALLKLKPVIAKERNKPSAKKRFAFIGEEVKKAFPAIVVTNKKGKVVDIKHKELSVVMLCQLQKQAVRIKSLENKLEKILNHILS